jgi:hypothetical protein
MFFSWYRRCVPGQAPLPARGGRKPSPFRRSGYKPELEPLEERALPDAGLLQFSSNQFLVGEKDGAATIRVVRTNGGDGTVAVHYATTGNGRAAAGVNYTAASGTLTFGPGETSKSFTVPIIDDGVLIGNQSVGLALSNPTGGAILGLQGGSSLTIIEKDGTPSQLFVNDVYLEVLQRRADTAGLAFWSGQIDHGQSRDQVVQAIQSSLEAFQIEVQELYATLLSRPADPSGLAAFVPVLQSGGTVEQVKAFILGSPEYLNNSGGTNAGFLDSAYLDTLDRAPDDAGRNVWLNQLNSGVSRTQVAAAIVTSGEAYTKVVQNMYLDILDRPADAAGLSFWVSNLQQGAFRDQQIVAMFLTSSELASLI